MRKTQREQPVSGESLNAAGAMCSAPADVATRRAAARYVKMQVKIRTKETTK